MPRPSRKAPPGMRTADEPMPDALIALRASLTERLAALRGVPAHALPPALLDVTLQRVRVPGGDVFLVRPVDWEQLRHEEGGVGRPVPYWATPWPSGAVLAGALAEDPPAARPRRARACSSSAAASACRASSRRARARACLPPTARRTRSRSPRTRSPSTS